MPALLTLLLLAAAPGPLDVPALRAAPKLDGNLKDFASALKLDVAAGPRGDAGTPTASAKLYAGTFKGTLYLGVEVTDDVSLPSDVLKLQLHFPRGGLGAEGLQLELGPLGLRVLPADAPEDLRRLIHAELTKGPGVKTAEVAIPARALPRFPAREPMVFDLCATYEDKDAPDATPVAVSNCELGSMLGAPLRLPDSFRSALGLKPPERVTALEGRDGAWLGYETLRYPLWLSADKDLTAAALASFVASPPVKPEDVRLAIPKSLSLPDARPLVPVLGGADPYATEGQCDSDRELRLGLYLIKGKIAERVLEWPVATCALGRALSVALEDDGNLTIGYSTGATTTFSWTGDHFERTEIGKR